MKLTQKLLIWTGVMIGTIIIGALLDKTFKDFADRLRFVGILSFMLIELSFN